MANVNPLHVKLLLIAFILIGVFALFSDFVLKGKDDKQKAIKKEFVICASAICVNKKIGQQCLEVDPALTRIVLAEDQNTDAQRIIIETGNKCSRHN
jgi:hypothetical protein